MGAMCSDISAQNWGTRGRRAARACCLNAASGSERRASTPAADDWARATMTIQVFLMRRVTSPASTDKSFKRSLSESKLPLPSRRDRRPRRCHRPPCPSSPGPRPSAPSLAPPATLPRTPPKAPATWHSSRLSASTPHVCTPPSLNRPPAQLPADTSELWRKIRYVVPLDAFDLPHLLLSIYVAFPASTSRLPVISSPRLMFLASLCHMCMGVQC